MAVKILFEDFSEDDDIEGSVACNGPSNIDKQYDFQCQAAYAYYCNVQTEALRQQCAYYADLQKSLGLPNCS